MSTKNIPSGNTAGTFAAGDDPRFTIATADATTTNKGLIQLGGDLGGTASTPYVLGGGALAYNYMLNPSFESDYVNWTPYGTYGTITRTNATAAQGTFSSRQVNATALDGGLLSTGVTLPAATYSFSFYMMISSDVINASVVVQGGSGNLLLFNKAYSSATDSAWNQYTGTFTLSSPQSVSLLVGMGSYGAKSSGTVYYDAFSIQAGAGNFTYFDGNTPGASNLSYAWTGNANQSQSTRQSRLRLQSTDQLAEGATNQYFTTARAWTNPNFTGTVTGVTKTMVGLANVDNTSDVNKPVSTAQQTAINGVYNPDPSIDYGLMAVNVNPAFCNSNDNQATGRSMVSKVRVAVGGTVASVVFYLNSAPTSITGAQIAVYASDGSRLGFVSDATSAYAATKNQSVPITLSRALVKGETVYVATITFYGGGTLSYAAPPSQAAELVNFTLGYSAASYYRCVYQNGQSALPATFSFTDTSWLASNYNRMIGLRA